MRGSLRVTCGVMTTTTHATGELWLVYSGLQTNDLNRLSSKGRTLRDAVLLDESDDLVRYAFPHASVHMKRTSYGSVPEAVAAIREFESQMPVVAGRRAQHHTLVLLPDGGPQRSEAAARILMAEGADGAIGASELEAVYENFLDFGEHSVTVSAAGMIIGGHVDDAKLQVYLYYVAQIGASVCRYAANEALLSDVMENIRAKSQDLDIETLQEVNVSTSKAMLDISDELLNIPPREGFILRTLLRTGNVEIYEERIGRMLAIIQHHVEHRHHREAERNARRIEFVLFVIAVLGALAGVTEIFGTSTDLANSIALAGGMVALSIVITLVASLWFYRTSSRR